MGFQEKEPTLLQKLMRQHPSFFLLGMLAILSTGRHFIGEHPSTKEPPFTTPLQSGTSDALAADFCRQIGLPHLVRTSPSSFICDSLVAPIPLEQNIAELPPTPPVEFTPRREIISYTVTVRPGDTFSQIIGQHFGTDEVYGTRFQETVFQNADWLARKTPAAKRAIEELKQHPDWTPTTNLKAWRLFMQATQLIHSEDVVSLKELLISIENREEETKPVGEETKQPNQNQEAGQLLLEVFGSGICDESWGSSPKGEEICKIQGPNTLCVQRGSGETPSFNCVKPQIGGRIDGDVSELQNQYFVVDKCPAIPGPCVGHLEKIEK